LKNDAAIEPGSLDALAAELNGALERFHQSGDDAQERALAASGRAEEAKELVSRNGDLETFERAHPAVLPFVGMIDAGRLDREARCRRGARRACG
jgi:hypothetical protein